MIYSTSQLYGTSSLRTLKGMEYTDAIRARIDMLNCQLTLELDKPMLKRDSHLIYKIGSSVDFYNERLKEVEVPQRDNHPELLESIDYTALYGDIHWKWLKAQLKRNPTQYEYNVHMDKQYARYTETGQVPNQKSMAGDTRYETE